VEVEKEQAGTSTVGAGEGRDIWNVLKEKVCRRRRVPAVGLFDELGRVPTQDKLL
jgi:hypothetical protein